MKSRWLMLVIGMAAVAALPPVAFADGSLSLQDAAVGVQLQTMPLGGTMLVTDLPWEEGNRPASAIVRRAEVFSDASRVHVMSEGGEKVVVPRRLPVFVGSGLEDPDTTVVMTLPAGGGLHVLAISPHGVHEYRRAGKARGWESAPERLREDQGRFVCTADELFDPPHVPVEESEWDRTKSVPSPTLTTYRATVAIETDYEFYHLFNDTTAATDYLGTVIAAASAIYDRDLSVQLQVGDVFLWTTASDPWTATTADGVLFEFGDYWHANRTAVVRDLAHFFSGKSLGGGVSWVGVVCSGDFWASNYSHWGGAYGICGNIDGTFDPNSSSPWVRWDLICSSHEIGHNFVSPHTHCYNDWPNPGDPPVDQCYSGETGCYSGATSLPADGGTIMSYCHGLSGGLANINLYFGLAGHYGVQSERVPQRMRAFVDSIANPPACLEEVVAGPIPGDADGDLDVDGDDLSLIAAEIFDLDGVATGDMCIVAPPCPEPEADGDDNGRIEAPDLAVAIQNS